MLGLLGRYGVVRLADVRSVPHSRAHPDFGRAALERHVAASGRRYTYLGAELGGRATGRSPTVFRNGLRRLVALSGHGRTAFLCAELRPEGCHRTRLVGAALAAAGVPVAHIDERGVLRSQAEVEARLRGGNAALDVGSPPVLWPARASGAGTAAHRATPPWRPAA